MMYGCISASAQQHSCSHTQIGYTMTDWLWRQDGESDVMQLQTLGGISGNITHCHKKIAYALSNSYSARQITEGNELWERMKDGKETIQVRRKHKGTEKLMKRRNEGKNGEICISCAPTVARVK